jgi:copper ion binding protein
MVQPSEPKKQIVRIRRIISLLILWNINKNLTVKENERMEKKTFSIPNISCGHCVMAIKNELSELDGIKMVEGNPEAKSIDVEWDAPITEDKIKETLKEINYPAA